MKSIKLIESLAQETLELLGDQYPPVDVWAVAKMLGVGIEYAELDEELSGVLVRREDGSAIIGVNWLHHKNRQRFTIAHEIGHFKLHSGGTYIDKGTYARFRDLESGSGTKVEEREANQFAAVLLMPREALLESFQRRHLDLGQDESLQQLADEFQVSSLAMSFRLARLGLLKL